jgi:sensor histidine kinase regulating citrate/malate metabolism
VLLKDQRCRDLEASLSSRIGTLNEKAGTVLANLLNNAIEAGRKEKNPAFTVTMRIVRNSFFCRITNHVSTDVLKVNAGLKTAKSDRQAHGHGLRIVRRTIEENNGMFDLGMENDSFCASFMLPLQAADPSSLPN